jgi:hypothetical protein
MDRAHRICLLAFSAGRRISNSYHRPFGIAWSKSEVLGRMLDREEALSHKDLHEVFHLIDHIVFNDPAIKDLFETAH